MRNFSPDMAAGASCRAVTDKSMDGAEVDKSMGMEKSGGRRSKSNARSYIDGWRRKKALFAARGRVERPLLVLARALLNQ